LPIEATVAGRVAFGFGITPKVWPRCTGAVEAFTLEFCAGMAAVSADLGCGARVTICGLAFIAGRFTFASISTGLGSGLGSGSAIFGASIASFGASGGGGSLISGGGGVFGFCCSSGAISAVIS
jgi:hypothetical protein